MRQNVKWPTKKAECQNKNGRNVELICVFLFPARLGGVVCFVSMGWKDEIIIYIYAHRTYKANYFCGGNRKIPMSFFFPVVLVSNKKRSIKNKNEKKSSTAMEKNDETCSTVKQ